MHTANPANPASPASASVVQSARPRFDPLGPVHKAIRCALSEMLVRMGQATFDDAAVGAQIVDLMNDVLDFCAGHAQHEETFVRPACEGKMSVGVFDTGHPTQERFISELRALGKAVLEAAPARRAEAGRTLYLHFGAYVGDTMLHMAEEETVLVPMLHRMFTDAELMAIQGRLMASLRPDELAKSARLFLRAVNRPERNALLQGMLARAPRAAVLGLLESARPTVSPDVYAELVAVVAASEAK